MERKYPMRIEDTPELFGAGCGSGTIAEIKCGFCGRVYNKGETGEHLSLDNESVEYTWFAGKMVCYCCFESLENEVLRRISDILPWYKRIVEAKRKGLEDESKNLSDVLKALGNLGS
jgi:hypothetical protein